MDLLPLEIQAKIASHLPISESFKSFRLLKKKYGPASLFWTYLTNELKIRVPEGQSAYQVLRHRSWWCQPPVVEPAMSHDRMPKVMDSLDESNVLEFSAHKITLSSSSSPMIGHWTGKRKIGQYALNMSYAEKVLNTSDSSKKVITIPGAKVVSCKNREGWRLKICNQKRSAQLYEGGKAAVWEPVKKEIHTLSDTHLITFSWDPESQCVTSVVRTGLIKGVNRLCIREVDGRTLFCVRTKINYREPGSNDGIQIFWRDGFDGIQAVATSYCRAESQRKTPSCWIAPITVGKQPIFASAGKEGYIELYTPFAKDPMEYRSLNTQLGCIADLKVVKWRDREVLAVLAHKKPLLQIWDPHWGILLQQVHLPEDTKSSLGLAVSDAVEKTLFVLQCSNYETAQVIPIHFGKR